MFVNRYENSVKNAFVNCLSSSKDAFKKVNISVKWLGYGYLQESTNLTVC